MKQGFFDIKLRNGTSLEVLANYEIRGPKLVAIELVSVYEQALVKGSGLVSKRVNALSERQYQEIEDKIADKVFTS